MAAAVELICVLASAPRASILRRRRNVNRGFDLSVQVPDPDFPVLTAGIDIPTVRAARWREMAPDQRLEYRVAAECDHAAIFRVGMIVVFVVRREAVVKIRCVRVDVHLVELVRRVHLPQVPELHHLVFAVAQHVSTIAFRVYVC